MKISRLGIRNFADGEAPTIINESVAGDDLVIKGGNRSGKTLTFNAIIYGVLGRDATFDVATGSSPDISIGFDNADRIQRKRSGHTFTHQGETYQYEDVDTKLTEILGVTDILELQFIHSETSKLPLTDLSKEERLSTIRRVSTSDIEEEIAELEQRREEVKNEIENVRRLGLQPAQEALDELELDQVSNRLERFREFDSLIESGRLEEIKDALQTDKDTRDRLEDLDTRRRALQKKLRKQRNKLQDARRYTEKVDSIILDAIRELTCPVCDRLVRQDLAERRMPQRCPQCGQEGSLDEVRENLESRVDTAEDAIDELKSEIDELENERGKITEKIQELKGSKPNLEGLNSPAVYFLKEYDYDIDRVVSEAKDELSKLDSQYDDLRTQKERLEQEYDDAEEKKNELENTRTKIERQIEDLKRQSFEEEISSFTEAWSSTYLELAPNLAAEIDLQEDGTIIIPGRDGIRQYSHLSTGEMRLVNLAFTLTLVDHAQSNDSINHSFEVLVLDEPFTNIDPEIRTDAIDYLKSSEYQFILTTSNEDVIDRFDDDLVESLERLPIQPTLSEVMEDE